MVKTDPPDLKRVILTCWKPVSLEFLQPEMSAIRVQNRFRVLPVREPLPH